MHNSRCGASRFPECPSHEELARFLAEELPPERVQTIEPHLDACPKCVEILARLCQDPRASTSALHAPTLLGGQPPSTGFLERLKNTPPSQPHAQANAEGLPITFPGLPTARGPLGQVGQYHIIAELGQGAMGTVYKAHDEVLNRLVALKVLKPELAALEEQKARFLREARTAATIQHERVVTLHQVVQDPSFPLPFLVMELITGEGLDRCVQQHGPLDARKAAQLVQQIALGLHAAHQHGLVHRDIKPSNILLDSTGRPKITDFGLARCLDHVSQRFTPAGVIVGTPGYMSPEQIRTPDAVDARCDIYALGVVLYELLTGTRPFVGQLHKVIDQIVSVDPTPPRKKLRSTGEEEKGRRGHIPADVETICLKCLEKEPERRYQSAAELAWDLDRFLRGEPILARPTSLRERTAKWIRRNPALGSLVVVLVLALVGLVVGLGVHNWLLQKEVARTEQERGRAEVARKKAVKEQGIAEAARQKAEDERGRAETARQKAEAAKQREQEARNVAESRVVQLHVQAGLERLRQGDLQGSLPWLTRALPLVPPGSPEERVHRLRIAAILRRCPRLIPVGQHSKSTAAPVTSLTFSPDGKLLLSTSANGSARLWKVSMQPTPVGPVLQHQERKGEVCVVNDGAFHPRGHLVATACGDGKVRIWRVPKGAPEGEERALETLLVGKPLVIGRTVNRVVFSPDGKMVAGAAGQKYLTSTTSKLYIPQPPLRIPNGRGGWTIIPRPPRTTPLYRPARGRSALWELGQEETKPRHRFSQPGWTCALAFSPDSKRLVTAGGAMAARNEARVWDVETGKPITDPLLHQGHVHHTAFSPDGRLVLTASGREVASGSGGREDGEARLWDSTTGKPVGVPMRHRGAVLRARFSPDGKQVLTASQDHTACLWDAETGGLRVALLRHRDRLTAAVFSRDGRRVATASQDQTACVYDATNGQLVAPPLRHDSPVLEVAFDPSGRFLATATRAGAVSLWDLAPQRQLLARKPGGRPARARVFSHGQPISLATLSPAGRVLMTVTGSPFTATTVYRSGRSHLDQGMSYNALHLWDVHTGRRLEAPVSLPGSRWHKTERLLASFAPGGRHLLLANKGEKLLGKTVWQTRVLDLSSGKQEVVATFTSEQAPFDLCQGHFLGKGVSQPLVLLSTTTRGKPDGGVQVHAVDTSRPVSPPIRFPEVTVPSRTGPSGARADRRPKVPVKVRPSITKAFFGAGGRMVVTIGSIPKQKKVQVRVWDTRTGALMGRPIEFSRAPRLLTLSPGGDILAWATNAPVFAPIPVEKVYLCDLARGKIIPHQPQHQERVTHLSFSPDGRLLATGSKGRVARVWDAHTGKPMTGLLEHGGAVLYTCVAAPFAPRRYLVATASVDGAARVWDATTGELLTPAFQHHQPVAHVSFGPKGQLISASRDGTARIWELSPTNEKPQTLAALAEWIACHRIDATGAFAPLDPRVRQQRWEELRKDRYFQSVEVDLEAWHRREAQDCLEKQLWKAACPHLDALLQANPTDWVHRAQKGHAASELSRWREAARAFEKARQEPTARQEDRLPFFQALALLGAGDVRSYRAHCERWLKASDPGGDPAVSYRVGRACVLTPEGCADIPKLLQLAERAQRPAGKGTPGSWISADAGGPKAAILLAAAHYRAGNPSEALKRLKGKTLWAAVFRTLAHRQLGQKEEAHQWLSKAKELSERPTRRPPTSGARADMWVQRLEERLLLQEISKP